MEAQSVFALLVFLGVVGFIFYKIKNSKNDGSPPDNGGGPGDPTNPRKRK